MRPHLSVTYSKKFQAVGETEAVDVNEVLRDYLPDVAFQKKTEFETAIKNLRKDWTPPGKLDATFTIGDNTFEVWKGNLADPAIKQIIKRIQILVPLFIEGGSAIPVDEPEDDRWTVFFLYQKKASDSNATRDSYAFAGYCTAYRFFHFRPPTPPLSPSEHKLDDLPLNGDFDLAQLPCRTRISQFIILPPFQKKGLGPRLYAHIFQEYINHPQTTEITVEDPNEAFDDMRDIADLHYLQNLPEFKALHINTATTIPKTGPAPNNIVDKTAWDSVRTKAKMTPRQFARVLEMHLMSQLPESVRPGLLADERSLAAAGAAGSSSLEPTKEHEHEYKLWRLLVKKRIYRHNKDALGELPLDQRIAKLEETVSSVEFDYARLLFRAEEHMKRSAGGGRVENGDGNGEVAKGKRKAEELEEEEEEEEQGEKSVSKKARVEDGDEE